MDWLDHKYINQLSSRLELFKRKTNTLYNFRCPICGDSKTNRHKSRGYIFDKQGKGIFHCHNCNATLSIPQFIKQLDQELYNQYNLDRMIEKKSPEQVDFEKFVDKMKTPAFRKEGPLKILQKVSQLKPDDAVKQFVMNRQIPTPYHAKLFKVNKFKQYINTLIPGKFDPEIIGRDECRLIIPFINKDGNVHALQGRAIGKSDIKYITIVLDESVPKLYGLDTLDPNQRTYVFEGPIDSMFISNGIATAGGDLISSIGHMDKSKLVIVYDNEPRSIDTYRKIDKAIMHGFKVCIWPDSITYKDVNDMILGGLTPRFVRYIIDSNTYGDLAAKMALNSWSKVK